MKKNFIEIIKKIDYVLILVFSILGIVLIGYELFSDLFYWPRTPQEMVVVESPAKKIEEKVEFCTKLKDTFVFKVKSSEIELEETEQPVVSSDVSNFSVYKKSSDGIGIANLVFVKKDGSEELKLFPRNAFIYRHKFYSDSDKDSRTKNLSNIYAVVKNDTNGDKVLNSKDDIHLYISDYDGKNLVEISQAIVTFEMIEDNQFLYTEYDGKNLIYYYYDLETEKKTKIKSVEQNLKEKYIDMYDYE